MSQCVTWILGRGGLLGSSLAHTLPRLFPRSTCWKPSDRFAWKDARRIDEQLQAAVREFAEAVRSSQRSWIVLWTAGAGVIGTTEADLDAETHTFNVLLSLLGQHLGEIGLPGLILLSSSAGGAFGNCPDRPITEDSICMPISAYGRNKLRQEALMHSWAAAYSGIGFLIARISNLYGSGQNVAKPQGLISQIARCLIWQKPIQIYVPLDTIRDYLHVDDCVTQITSCLAGWLNSAGAGARDPLRRIKIFASEQTTSVAQLIAAFSRLAPRYHPRVICAPSRLGVQQPRQLQFRSIVPPDLSRMPRTPLQVGVNQVYRHQLELYCRPSLTLIQPR